jgi:hypothetical protein
MHSACGDRGRGSMAPSARTRGYMAFCAVFIGCGEPRLTRTQSGTNEPSAGADAHIAPNEASARAPSSVATVASKSARAHPAQPAQMIKLKPLVPPEVVRRFFEDMRAFHRMHRAWRPQRVESISLITKRWPRRSAGASSNAATTLALVGNTQSRYASCIFYLELSLT